MEHLNDVFTVMLVLYVMFMRWQLRRVTKYCIKNAAHVATELSKRQALTIKVALSEQLNVQIVKIQEDLTTQFEAFLKRETERLRDKT